MPQVCYAYTPNSKKKLSDGDFAPSKPIKPRIDYIPAPDSFECLSDDAFLRLKQLRRMHLVPFSDATLWRKCRSGEFPAPVKISTQITAWRVGDIRQYLRNLHKQTSDMEVV